MSGSEYNQKQARLRGAGNAIKAAVDAQFKAWPDRVVETVKSDGLGLEIIEESAVCLTSIWGQLLVKRQRKVNPDTGREYMAGFKLDASIVDLERASQEIKMSVHSRKFSVVDTNYPKFHECIWRPVAYKNLKTSFMYIDPVNRDATEDEALGLAEQMRLGDLLLADDAAKVTDKIAKTPDYDGLRQIVNGSWRDRLLNFIVPPPN